MNSVSAGLASSGSAPVGQTPAPGSCPAGAVNSACVSPLTVSLLQSRDEPASLSGALAQERPDVSFDAFLLESSSGVEQGAVNARVAGSTPASPAIINNSISLRNLALKAIFANASQVSSSAFIVVSSGGLSCVLSTSGRSRALQKSKDGFRQARTYLSKALWGRCARCFGPKKRTRMSQLFAAAIRGMRAAICPARSPSPPSCLPPSTSGLPRVHRRRRPF